MTRLVDHGISIDVPSGWEARMSVPGLAPPAVNLPVLHMADYRLTHARQSSYAVETAAAMEQRTGGVIVSLIEFGSELADIGLYAPQGAPTVHARDLDGRALQIPRVGPGRRPALLLDVGARLQPLRRGQHRSRHRNGGSPP